MGIAEQIEIAVGNYHNQHQNNPSIIITHPSSYKRLEAESLLYVNNPHLKIKNKKLPFMGIEVICSEDLELDEIRVY